MRKTISLFVIIFALCALSWVPGCSSVKGGKSVAAQEGAKTAAKASLPAEPDVSFTDLQGKSVALSSLKGKVVVVNFWATWCEPCQVEIPWMIEFQQKYEGRGFTVLGVAMDDEGKSIVEPFVAKKQFDVDGHPMNMNYPIVLGNDDLSEKFGGLIGLPTSLVISRDGKLVKRFIGLVNHDSVVKEIEGQL
jgi:thiol-disulfide isomerase/thioredoxin